MYIKSGSQLKAKHAYTGATLVEFLVIAPTLLFMILGTMQTGLVFHAKSNLKYAAFEAARTGTMTHNNINQMLNSFARAMTGYYGGGRTTKELADSRAKAFADINSSSTQIQILSPTKESFDDYNSPSLAKRLGVKTRVIPNTNIAFLNCPNDRPSCNADPSSNQSGQTLQDANLLKIKITYGIPVSKQVPFIGKFYVKVLEGLKGIRDETSVLTGLNAPLKTTAVSDAFKLALLKQGRIPVEVYSTMRMQSEAFENGNISNPGSGNGGTPVNPDADTSEIANQNTNPPIDNEPCDPLEALFGCDEDCAPGDPTCDKACQVACCGLGASAIKDINDILDTSTEPTATSIPGTTGVEIFTQQL